MDDHDARLARIERQLEQLAAATLTPRLLSDAEAAHHLRISVQTLIRMFEDAPENAPGYPITVAVGERRRQRRWDPRTLPAFCDAVARQREHLRTAAAKKRLKLVGRVDQSALRRRDSSTERAPGTPGNSRELARSYVKAALKLAKREE